MQVADRAVEILRQAEVKLRDLLSEAAASADYSSVVQIAAWAKTLRDLTWSVSSKGEVRTSVGLTKKTVRATADTSVPKRLPRKAHELYPRFFRRSNQLIRVAWSRKEKKEYLHKAPYTAVEAVVTALVENGAEGRVFSMEDVLPVHDADGSKVPDYQAYVVISILKQTGLIDTHGRRGYSVPRTAQFKNAFETVWTKLPQE